MFVLFCCSIYFIFMHVKPHHKQAVPDMTRLVAQVICIDVVGLS